MSLPGILDLTVLLDLTGLLQLAGLLDLLILLGLLNLGLCFVIRKRCIRSSPPCLYTNDFSPNAGGGGRPIA